MTARRALVTGAAGFVGANLVRRLAADGHNVVAVGVPGGDDWRLDGVEGVEKRHADLTEAGAPSELLSSVEPEWVFHLAAHGAYSWQRDSHRIIATNSLATQALLEAAVACGAEAFVLAGTSSEYGYKDHPPAESEAVEPNSVYAASKAAATMLAMHAAAESDLAVSVLRLYSAYGPWEDPRRLIPRLVALGLDGRLPDLVDPSTARDFVAVDDAVEAFTLAAARDGGGGAIYNVGTGRQTTLGEVVELVRDVLGVEEEPRWGSAAARDWDTTTWVSDPSLIAAELGWRAETSLRDGLAAMAEWLRAAPPEVRARYSEA